MPLPNPTSLWKFAKFALRASEYVVPPALAWLEHDLAGNETHPDPIWMRWTTEILRATPTGTVEDKAQFKVDLLNITAGEVDDTWIAADFTTVKTRFDTYLNAIKTFVPQTDQFVTYKAYRMAFNPSDPGPGNRTGPGNSAFADTGAPVYRTDIAISGTGSTILPYQVAMSHTLRTAWPKHWGRYYMPGPGSGVTTSGRISSANAQSLANATVALLGGLADDGFLAVVPVTQLEKDTFHALLGVTQVVVDDIPDVIRRRRPKQAAVHAVGV